MLECIILRGPSLRNSRLFHLRLVKQLEGIWFRNIEGL